MSATSTWFWISSTEMPSVTLTRLRMLVITSWVAKLPTERNALAIAR